MVKRQYHNNATLYHNGLMTGTYAQAQARETERNVKSAIKWLKVLVLSLAALGIIATTSGCTNDGDVLIKVECSLFPAGGQPPSCN